VTWEDSCPPSSLTDDDQVSLALSPEHKLDAWKIEAQQVAVSGHRPILEDGSEFSSAIEGSADQAFTREVADRTLRRGPA
jgi:hypothetical protein